jgi:hypothetical protein
MACKESKGENSSAGYLLCLWNEGWSLATRKPLLFLTARRIAVSQGMLDRGEGTNKDGSEKKMRPFGHQRVETAFTTTYAYKSINYSDK